MSQISLFHNPRCSKSRGALELLEERGIQPEVIRYLENPPSAAELKALLGKLDIGARQLLRTGEDEYKTLDLANPALSDEQLIAAMASHPKLIERPILIVGDKAVIGRPPEKVLEILP
ncbi:arsenate reductase (glutaredoxin) [Pseudomonas sp. LA21]|uniref:arsenate reductase (glutaredoxin) n=1 Tax=unclassified Pseudomonas TaxID=196821 RepID=UPI001FB6D824|nr:arsenate reductase (glutaredoxin) [Pseudomonas sp. LA21]MCJ1885225.1 arsenate reductase (glutaredoxin) [Pseudomonas sp. LA21]